MLTFALLAMPGLALLLLAAHLLHAGLLPLAVLALLLAGLLAVRRPWAARVLQAVLLLAAVEWILTTVTLAQMRLQHGQPYLRLALILAANDNKPNAEETQRLRLQVLRNLIDETLQIQEAKASDI